jgi:hypothetical protein
MGGTPVPDRRAGRPSHNHNKDCKLFNFQSLERNTVQLRQIFPNPPIEAGQFYYQKNKSETTESLAQKLGGILDAIFKFIKKVRSWDANPLYIYV